MKAEDFSIPRAPDWHVDLSAFERYGWAQSMLSSTQDPISHAEGDVWTHTVMVTESLVALRQWRELPEERMKALFCASILHDVAKPATRTEENGRIRNPGHSLMGSMDARGMLWKAGVEREIREMCCNIILFHQAPFWLVERPQWKAEWLLARAVMEVLAEDIALHAVADTMGRICPDRDSMLQSIELFLIMAQEAGAFYPGTGMFYNNHARVRYFSDPENISFRDCPPDMTSDDFEVVVMSGIPGSGKSTVAERIASDRGIPILSLDAMRSELGIKPEENQGKLIQFSQEKARELLRKKQSFVWDSTNLTMDQRGRILNLAHAYGARSHVVSVERTFQETMAGNRNREHIVPDAIMARMIRKWEPPTLAECHSREIVFPEPHGKPAYRR